MGSSSGPFSAYKSTSISIWISFAEWRIPFNNSRHPVQAKHSPSFTFHASSPGVVGRTRRKDKPPSLAFSFPLSFLHPVRLFLHALLRFLYAPFFLTHAALFCLDSFFCFPNPLSLFLDTLAHLFLAFHFQRPRTTPFGVHEDEVLLIRQ